MIKLIQEYQKELNNRDLGKAYKYLLSFIMKVRGDLSKYYDGKFEMGNLSPGYLDYSYFPFSNNLLIKKGLRFGIVLNHSEMQIELWLMGRNAKVQKDYWQKLRTSKWNRHLTAMPKYSVLETVLIVSPDFADIDKLLLEIRFKTGESVEEIIKML